MDPSRFYYSIDPEDVYVQDEAQEQRLYPLQIQPQPSMQLPPPPLRPQAYHQHPLYQQPQHDQQPLAGSSSVFQYPVSEERIQPNPWHSHASEALYHSDRAPSLPNNIPVPATSTAPPQGADDKYPSSSTSSVPHLPPILQVERQHVATTATQAASARRRRNEATFKCPVPGCGSSFTRRFNLKGHLRSHTSERPYVCNWPGCERGFARQHDCKRHYQLHLAKPETHACQTCGRPFSRMDALSRHLRSDSGAECRAQLTAASLREAGPSTSGSPQDPQEESAIDEVPGFGPSSI